MFGCVEYVVQQWLNDKSESKKALR